MIYHLLLISEYKNSYNYDSKTGTQIQTWNKRKNTLIGWKKIYKHALYQLFRDFSLKFPDTLSLVINNQQWYTLISELCKNWL